MKRDLAVYITGMLIGIAIGASFMKAFPPKKDQKLGYEIACLDGQISILDSFAGNQLKTCRQLWEEKEDK